MNTPPMHEPARGDPRAARLRPLRRNGLPFVVLTAMLGVLLPRADAAIPAGVSNTALFKKGYLDVTAYGVVPNDANSASANTIKINDAIKDAYNLNNDTPFADSSQKLKGSLVLYFPLGTYYIDDTLKVHTATGRWVNAATAVGKTPDTAPKFEGAEHATPRNHLAMVGETTSVLSQRPIIRLKNSSPGFNSPSNPKVMLEFKNFGGIWRDDLQPNQQKAELGSFVVDSNTKLYINQKQLVEDPSRGYHQMLRGIDLHTGTAGNTGTIALQFNQAQESSVENVKITAGAALAGIRGLPGRGWGAVNVEIDQGDVGIDLMAYPNPGIGIGITPTSNVGSVIVGAKLTNQRRSAIEYGGFVPLTVVGFEIDHPGSGSEVSTSPLTIASSPVAPQIAPGNTLYNSLINLIDGKIILRNGTHAAIDNINGRSLYVRNVYVTEYTSGTTQDTGSTTLVRTNTSEEPHFTATGAWKRIDEYSYTDQRTDSTVKGQGETQVPQVADKLIDGNFVTTVVTAAKTDSAPTPGDMRQTHIWKSIPSVDSAGVVDVTIEDPTIVPAVDDLDPKVVNHTKLQNIIDDYSAPNPKKRIFLPKGIYRLTGPITLRSNTTLFGAARHLTRIEVAPSWTAQLVNTPALRVETAMITTASSTTATTYLGDLSIGVDTSDNNILGDWFTALNWSAGKNSMVHIGQVYRSPVANNDHPTNDHSILKITGNGGGRWYFPGARKTGHGWNTNFRILEATSTVQPLWLYGHNLEHPGGPREYASFSTVENVRLYGGKTEYVPHNDLIDLYASDKSAVVRFTNSKNVAAFGLGAIRNGLSGGRGAVEFFDPDPFPYVDTDLLATLIAPQVDGFSNESFATTDKTVRETLNTAATSVTASVAYPNLVSLYKRGALNDTAMQHTANNVDY